MEKLTDILNQRRSIRGYLSNPVPEEVLKSIFNLAQMAPSNCNSQPWQIHCVSGSSRDKLSLALREAAANDIPPDTDFEMFPAFNGIHRERQVQCASALYENIGIERGNKEGRKDATLRNFDFFDAPHAAFITMPRGFGVFNALDVGIYLDALMLSMTYYGVSSCAQGALALYPNIVRSVLNISSENAVLAGLSFGYQDESHPANRTVTERATLDQVVSFYG